MNPLFLGVCLALVSVQRGPIRAPLQAQPAEYADDGEHGDCEAGNARENTDRTPLLGGPGAIQHVPVVSGGGRYGEFYVAYSAKSPAGPGPCTVRNNNSVISIFQLSPIDPSKSHILIFGTGYGTRYLNGSPCDGAQYQDQGAIIDAKNVNSVVRRCMGLRGTVLVDVVVPHSHGDHINPEFLHELEELDYKVQAIMTHADDLGATRNVDVSITTHTPKTGKWGALKALIQPFGKASSPPCLQTVCTERFEDSPLRYISLLGPIWFRERGGHTPGATDLVLDTLGDVNRRYVVYGSSPPGTGPASRPNCMAPLCDTTLTGVLSHFNIHGNLRYGK